MVKQGKLHLKVWSELTNRQSSLPPAPLSPQSLGEASMHVATALSSLVACREQTKRYAEAAEAAAAAARSTAEATGAESPLAGMALVKQAQVCVGSRLSLRLGVIRV